MSKYVDLTGKKIGYWKVNKRAENKNGLVQWECICECGTIRNRSTGQVNTHSHHSCGCSRIDTYGDIPGYLWSNIKISAKRRKIDFKITAKEAWNQFVLQNSKCILSGLKLSFSNQNQRDDSTASLDRIDSKKDYSVDNIQWLHKDINIMKGQLSVDKYIGYCNIIANPYSKKEFEYQFSIVGGLWFGLQCNAKKRNLSVEVDKNYLLDLFYKQNTQCNITGLQLTLPKNHKEFRSFIHTASIDRIDSTKGYIKGNIQWLHKDINAMKMHFNQDYFIKLSRSIAKYND